jgi:hypothetical protein
MDVMVRVEMADRDTQRQGAFNLRAPLRIHALPNRSGKWNIHGIAPGVARKLTPFIQQGPQSWMGGKRSEFGNIQVHAEGAFLVLANLPNGILYRWSIHHQSSGCDALLLHES